MISHFAFGDRFSDAPYRVGLHAQVSLASKSQEVREKCFMGTNTGGWRRESCRLAMS